MDPFTLTMMGLGLGMQGAGMFGVGQQKPGMMAPNPTMPQPQPSGGSYKQPFQMPSAMSMISPPQRPRQSPIMQYMNPSLMNYYAGGVR